jgi:adenosylcobinamide kinase/adenosylcobinamide-phosphate guanylyltransferase
MIGRARDARPGPLPPPGRLPVPGRPRRGKPFRVLILGGARSGKSLTAERLLAGRDKVDYVATGPLADETDPEWADRVRLHQARRPAHWTTLETLDLAQVLTGSGPARPGVVPPELTGSELARPGVAPPELTGSGPAPARTQATPVLVDCLSTWLAGVMEECGLWAGSPGADKKLLDRVDGLVDAWRTTRRQVVAVSNEVGSGVVPGTASGVRFRDELGVLNARIAAECEQVWLCTAGIARRLR